MAQYRANGRSRRLTVGSVEKLTAATARDEARRILAKVTFGGDPQGEKAAKRRQATRTFRSAVDTYLAARESELRPSSLYVTKLYLTGSYFRPLHSVAMSEIAHPDVAARISAIERTNGTATAGAARRAISAFFGWAIAEGLLGRNPINPVIGTRKPADPKARSRVLTERELVAIWRACGSDDFGRIIRLLILLGNRRQEVGDLRRSELELDAGIWRLPAERSKNHRPHTLILPPAALQILREVPQQGGRDYLFGPRNKGFKSWHDCKRQLDRRLGTGEEPWRIHDIRRSVATRLGDLGVQPHVIEALLNHHSGHRRGVAGVYNRSPYEREVTAALAMWAEYVLALVEKRESKVVVSLRA